MCLRRAAALAELVNRREAALQRRERAEGELATCRQVRRVVGTVHLPRENSMQDAWLLPQPQPGRGASHPPPSPKPQAVEDGEAALLRADAELDRRGAALGATPASEPEVQELLRGARRELDEAQLAGGHGTGSGGRRRDGRAARCISRWHRRGRAWHSTRHSPRSPIPTCAADSGTQGMPARYGPAKHPVAASVRKILAAGASVEIQAARGLDLPGL